MKKTIERKREISLIPLAIMEFADGAEKEAGFDYSVAVINDWRWAWAA